MDKKCLKFFAAIFSLCILLFNCSAEPSIDNSSDSKNPDNKQVSKIEKWDIWSQKTRLRGANIYQRKVYPELDGTDFMGSKKVGPLYTRKDFDDLSKLGANYVNISYPGIYQEKPPYNLDPAILENLKNLVNIIGKADMFVVISLRTGPGRSEFTFFWGEDEDWFDKSYYNDQVWKEKSAQDAWGLMWKELAVNFKDNKFVVGYDLMVEPNSNEVWLDEWEPKEFYTKYGNTLYDWNQFYPNIITQIRKVDKKTPILAGAMAYSNLNWLPFLRIVDDKKTVYMFHQYIPSVYTHQEGTQIKYPGVFDTNWDQIKDKVNREWLKNLMQTAENFKKDKNVQVGVNEYGLVRWAPGGDQFIKDLMEIFENQDLNYAIWEWSPSNSIYTDEVNAFNFRFGPDKNNKTNIKNKLLDVITDFWSKNSIKPSNTHFK
jgi:hypothetical protein